MKGGAVAIASTGGRGGLAREPKRRPLVSWAAGLASGSVLVLAPATVLMLALQFAPSIIVRVIDDTSDRGAFRAVLLCNLAGATGPLIRAWRNGPPDLSRALAILSEPAVLCTAWLAGSAAWVGTELLAFAAQRVLTLRDTRLDAHLSAEIERLRHEWGPDTERPGT